MDYNETTMSSSPSAAALFDEGEIEVAGRILSDAEYSRLLSMRGDIFRIDRDRRLRDTVLACLLFGVGAGMFMSTIRLDKIPIEFLDKPMVEGTVIIRPTPVVVEPNQGTKDVPKIGPEKIKTDIRNLKKNNKPGSGGTSGGGGDPLARVTQKGVLGILSGKITGRAVANADIFGKGGFASNIDGILPGNNGLKSMGPGGEGRKGVEGIGFGPGTISGFNGGDGSTTDDLIGELLASKGESGFTLQRRSQLAIQEPRITASSMIQTGGRSRASIMRVVAQNILALRYAYNKRLREKPGLKGKITCKFAIDEFGRVIFCDLLESTMADPELESDVRDKIGRWVFEKIDKPGDVTEVEYPFVFSQ